VIKGKRVFFEIGAGERTKRPACMGPCDNSATKGVAACPGIRGTEAETGKCEIPNHAAPDRPSGGQRPPRICKAVGNRFSNWPSSVPTLISSGFPRFVGFLGQLKGATDCSFVFCRNLKRFSTSWEKLAENRNFTNRSIFQGPNRIEFVKRRTDVFSGETL